MFIRKAIKMSWLGSSLINQEGLTSLHQDQEGSTNTHQLKTTFMVYSPPRFAREEHLERLSKQHDRIIPLVKGVSF